MNARALAVTLLISLSLGSACILASGLAAAEQRPASALLHSTCVTERPPVEGFAALALELEGRGLPLTSGARAPEPDELLIAIDDLCSLESRVLVRVSVRESRREREVWLGDTPGPSRARVVALATAELVDLLLAPIETDAGAPTTPAESSPQVAPSTSQTPASGAPTQNSKPNPSAKPRRADPRPQRAPHPALTSERGPASDARPSLERASTVSLRTSPQARWYVGGSLLWGGRVELQWHRWFVGGDVLSNETVAPLGTVSTTLFHGVAGVRISELEAGRWSFAWGPRVGVGAVRARGVSRADGSERRVTDTYFDVAAFAGSEVALGSVLALGTEIEAGYARGLAASGGHERVAVYGGPLVGWRLTVGLNP